MTKKNVNNTFIVWFLENIVPYFSDPIGYYVSKRIGCYCLSSHIELGRFRAHYNWIVSDLNIL